MIMAFLSVAAISGVWLVFREPLEHVFRVQLHVVAPQGTSRPDDEIVSRVETAFPGARVSLLQLPQERDESMSLDVVPRQSGTSLAFDRVYVNPYTGRLLGERRMHSPSFDSVDSFIYGLHIQLVGGRWGYRAMGVVALVWLLSSLMGLVLAWPALWRRWRAWQPVLTIRPGNTYQFNYDLHRAGGLWLLPVSVMLAFTAVTMNLPEIVRPVVSWLSPLSHRSPGIPIRPEDATVTFGEADATVRERFPNGTINNIYRDFSNGRYSVYFHLPEDVNPEGDDFALVDLRSGKITAIDRPAQRSAGDRFMAWIFPLHSGLAFGWPSRLLIALSGIVIVATNGASLFTWIVRWRRRYRSGPEPVATESPTSTPTASA